MNRNLDLIFFRVTRNGISQSVCFSDLTSEEMDEALGSFDNDSLKRMCKMLGQIIRNIGDELDIVYEVVDQHDVNDRR